MQVCHPQLPMGVLFKVDLGWVGGALYGTSDGLVVRFSSEVINLS